MKKLNIPAEYLFWLKVTFSWGSLQTEAIVFVLQFGGSKTQKGKGD